jgi:hypothetical protein
MSNWYTNAILTIIALLLAAVAAKLYLPAAQLIGPQISPPTRGEMAEARKLSDWARLEDLRARVPAVWVNGGDIEVSGSVYVDNTVEIEGEVSIVR